MCSSDLRLSGKGLQTVRRKHPWIFENSIEKLSAEAEPGDVAVVYDNRKIVAAGLVDPYSSIRVRLLTFGASKEVVGPGLFRLLAKQSAERRNGLFGPETNAFRLINGESDGFPGLVADKYADVLVMKVYTAAFIPHLGDVADALFEVYP